MKKNIKNLFSEELQNVLTEDTLTAIEEAFNQKVNLSVEAALLEQDEVYADKLKSLINTLDKDRTVKMKRVVEAIDKNNASKLVNVVKKYERQSKQDFKKFKGQLVESISSYLDAFLKESLDEKDFSQAVKNKTAFNVLENLRKVLAVDSVLMKESVQEAVIDGKNQIVSLQKENADLKKKYEALVKVNQKTETVALIESKTAKFNETKKNFVKKALEDKSPQFIKENFDYVVRLFDKQEKSKLQTLKEDAMSRRQVSPDVIFEKPKKVIEEKVNNNQSNNLTSEYLNVLSKGKGMK